MMKLPKDLEPNTSLEEMLRMFELHYRRALKDRTHLPPKRLGLLKPTKEELELVTRTGVFEAGAVAYLRRVIETVAREGEVAESWLEGRANAADFIGKQGERCAILIAPENLKKHATSIWLWKQYRNVGGAARYLRRFPHRKKQVMSGQAVAEYMFKLSVRLTEERKRLASIRANILTMVIRGGIDHVRPA